MGRVIGIPDGMTIADGLRILGATAREISSGPHHDNDSSATERCKRFAGAKNIEYRQIKPYWTKRFAKVSLHHSTDPIYRERVYC